MSRHCYGPNHACKIYIVCGIGTSVMGFGDMSFWRSLHGQQRWQQQRAAAGCSIMGIGLDILQLNPSHIDESSRKHHDNKCTKGLGCKAI